MKRSPSYASSRSPARPSSGNPSLMRGGSFRRLVMYFYLTGKRIFTILPSAFLVSLLLLLAVWLIGRGFFKSSAEDASRQNVRIGIVGSYEDTFLELAVTALQNLDTSRFSMELVRLPEQEARRELRGGRLSAYVVIPPDFFDSVNYYRNDVQITYVSTEGAVGIGTVIIDELAGSVSSLLLESENAVYGMQSCARDYYGDVLTDEEISNLGYAMTELYGLVILSREKLFEVHETGLSDALSFRDYYFTAMLVLFLLLSAVPFAPLFADRDRSLFRLLSARGIGPAKQVLAEYLSYALTLCALIALLMPLLGFLLSKSGMAMNVKLISLLPYVLLAVLPVSAAQFLLYELFSGAVPGILMQIMTALCGAYVCGCFYPAGFLPESMQHIAAVLPAGSARLLIGEALRQQLSGRTVLTALCLCAACLLASVFARAFLRHPAAFKQNPVHHGG